MYSLAKLSEQSNKKTPEKCLFSGVLAHLRGFEPPACRLGGDRSILLSYGEIGFAALMSNSTVNYTCLRLDCQPDASNNSFFFFVGLQYILDSEKKKDEGFAQIGYCEFGKNNKDRKEVQIPHDNCNTGYEVQAIPNVLREEIWRSASVTGI